LVVSGSGSVANGLSGTRPAGLVCDVPPVVLEGAVPVVELGDVVDEPVTPVLLVALDSVLDVVLEVAFD
jgi:hypothetical protein